MSALSYAMSDAATMLRRNLRHALRYPSLTIGTLLVPVIILLLFVGLLGDALSAGIGAAAGGVGYADYIAPGIIVITMASSCVSTSVSVCVDMTSGIVDRFRTMPISRPSLLIAHLAGGTIRTLASTALVVGLAVLLGFRPTARLLDWIALFGLLVLITFALTWLAILIGLVSQTPEAASNTPVLIAFLPFVSSAFVPTDSLPAGVRWLAEEQPFTPMIETIRGLLLGTPIGDSALLAVGWCVALATAGYLAALAVFNRPRAS